MFVCSSLLCGQFCGVCVMHCILFIHIVYFVYIEWMVGNWFRMSYKCMIIECCCPSVMGRGVRYWCGVSVAYGCGGGLRYVRGGGVRRPSMSSFHTRGHSQTGGGYGIYKGCAFWVSVKSVHLPHTLPKIIFSSSLLAIQSWPHRFLDNDRKSFPENKRTHKYAMSQNTITTSLEVLFRTYFIYKWKAWHFCLPSLYYLQDDFINCYGSYFFHCIKYIILFVLSLFLSSLFWTCRSLQITPATTDEHVSILLGKK